MLEIDQNHKMNIADQFVLYHLEIDDGLFWLLNIFPTISFRDVAGMFFQKMGQI